MKKASAVALAILVVSSLLFGAAISLGESDPARRLFDLANSERAANGLPNLESDAELLPIANRHSRQMAESGRLEHNPDLGREVKGWQVIGENVGNGRDADEVHLALMGSSTHRAQILDRDYKGMAVGVAVMEDKVWFTQLFILRNPSPPLVINRVPKPKVPRAGKTAGLRANAEPETPIPNRPVRLIPAPPRLEVAAWPHFPTIGIASKPLVLIASGLIVIYLLAVLCLARAARRLAPYGSTQAGSTEYILQRSGAVGHYAVNPQFQ